jgi:hypothetical protein
LVDGWGRWMGVILHLHKSKKKIKKKNKKKIKKKKSFIYLDMSVFLLTFATTEDNTESSPLPAAIGSNESLVLDRVGRI